MTYVNATLPFRALGRLVVLAAVLVGVLIAGSGTAHALSTMNEGFERAHGSLQFQHGGTGGGQLVLNPTPLPGINPNLSRSGNGHAYLSARNVGSWSAVDRTFGKIAQDVNCYASAYVNPMGASRRVGLKVFTPAGTIRKAVAQTVSGSSYQLVSTGWFYSADPTLVARVVMSSSSANTETIRVDDLKVVCETLF